MTSSDLERRLIPCSRVFSLLNRCHRVVLLLALIFGVGMPLPLLGAQAQVVPEPRTPLPISVGDQLRIETWREELYSGVFTVDAAGRVTLPQVGVWTVTGLTADALRDRLTAAWGETLRDPLVQVTVLRRIRVLGEVLTPGVFYLDETLSVADALAMAGGRSALAREGEVRFRRGGEETLLDVRSDARLGDLGVQTGDELFVPREGWWSRNVIPVVGAAGGLLGLAVALVLR
jgi:protein involved in polysaccharide export with SLBB domain